MYNYYTMFNPVRLFLLATKEVSEANAAFTKNRYRNMERRPIDTINNFLENQSQQTVKDVEKSEIRLIEFVRDDT